MKTFFRCVVVGDTFKCGGNEYCKKSSRTAWAVGNHPASGRWFYFGQMEQVEIVK